MTNHFLTFEIQEGELKEIMDEIDKAQNTIYRCYNRLTDLGVVSIKKKPPAATDGEESPIDALSDALKYAH